MAMMSARSSFRTFSAPARASSRRRAGVSVLARLGTRDSSSRSANYTNVLGTIRVAYTPRTRMHEHLVSKITRLLSGHRAILLTLLLTGMCLSTASRVIAQDQSPIAVTVAGIYSIQSSQRFLGVEDPSILLPAVGGSAPGLVIGVEVPVSRMFGVAVELSDIARFDAMQAGGDFYETQTIDHHRDLIVSALFRVHRSVNSHVSVSVLGGGSYVREDTLVQARTATVLGAAPTGQYGPEYSLTRDTTGGVVGLDLDVHLSSHISIGPTLRAHFISRAAAEGGAVSNAVLGLATGVFRFGGLISVSL